LKKFLTLYKKTSTGAIQYWDIAVYEMAYGFHGRTDPAYGANIITKYGQIGTDNPQETKDSIMAGKNVGKKNETTPYAQAEAEAQSKWEKQKKKGYVESIEAAQNDELDDLIEGGVVPMLAHKFSDQGHKIKFPAHIQPKLDGIRCIAVIKDGECTLWSRTRKKITSMPHIAQELEAVFETKDIVLDGELYNHDFRDNFEHIVSMVRQEEPDERHTDVQYHIYDIVSEDQFNVRNATLVKLFDVYEFFTLKLVETFCIPEEKVMDIFNRFRDQGYEGAMLRNSTSLYVNKRSYDLQKVKQFEDDEFEIIGVEEGRGKLAGHVGAFVCKMSNGKEFLAKSKGSTERLKAYWDNPKLWLGKKLTVQYQGLTGAEKVPRFPVGIEIRDYE
jgi:DNA ligase-1